MVLTTSPLARHGTLLGHSPFSTLLSSPYSSTFSSGHVMAELTFENPAAFADFVQSLEGAQVARILSIASFSLVVYDYAITLDEEVSKLV